MKFLILIQETPPGSNPDCPTRRFVTTTEGQKKISPPSTDEIRSDLAATQIMRTYVTWTTTATPTTAGGQSNSQCEGNGFSVPSAICFCRPDSLRKSLHRPTENTAAGCSLHRRGSITAYRSNPDTHRRIHIYTRIDVYTYTHVYTYTRIHVYTYS